MKSILRAAIFVVIAVAGLWLFFDRPFSYRFRVIVEVEKEGIVHSGSSVIELTTWRHRLLSGLDNIGDWETSHSGEAVFVDLGDGENLIMLLAENGYSESATLMPARAILGDEVVKKTPGCCRWDLMATNYRSMLDQIKDRIFVLKTDQLPSFIKFDDLSDPFSVKAVSRKSLNDSYRGPVRLNAIRISITDDEHDRIICRKLPFLAKLRSDQSLSGRIGTLGRAGVEAYSTPGQIAVGDLIEGFACEK